MGKTDMDHASTPTATRSATSPDTGSVEGILRTQLAKGDRALSGVAPVLSHMLASSGHALVNEDVVARLRGMLSDCARQLIDAAQTDAALVRPDQSQVDSLADHFAENGPILSHLYTLAMEGHLASRLEQQSSLDPMLSPLLQELIASDQNELADLAMVTLAAQSRFIQAQRRMVFPITELPARLFHAILESWQDWTRNSGKADGMSEQAAAVTLRSSYDEASTRLALLTRLTGAMRNGAIVGLELEHAGLSLFATCLATLTRQPRDLAILACHDRQAARLALGLRASGLDQTTIERQFLLLVPGERLPRDLDHIDPAKAANLLSQSAAWKGR
ncbi:MAG: hypothetical protein AAGL10_02740 [Pseudomonadota bacterium]